MQQVQGGASGSDHRAVRAFPAPPAAGRRIGVQKFRDLKNMGDRECTKRYNPLSGKDNSAAASRAHAPVPIL